MNQQKVSEALKEIFDRYGKEVIRNQSRFLFAFFDLIDQRECPNERLVFRYAFGSTAMEFILLNPPVTSEIQNKAIRQLRDECHMTAEDSEFVVQTLIAACEYNSPVFNIFAAVQGQPKSVDRTSSATLNLPVCNQMEGDPTNAMVDYNLDSSCIRESRYLFRSKKNILDLCPPKAKLAKRLTHAKKSYLDQFGYSDNEEILIFYDNTVTANGKRGFVLTDRGIYSTGSYQHQKPFFLHNHQVKSVELAQNEVEILVNHKEMAIFQLKFGEIPTLAYLLKTYFKL